VTDIAARRGLSRRSLFLGGTGLVAGTLIGTDLLTGGAAQAAPPAQAPAAPALRTQKSVHLVGTDGWVAMPDNAPADPPFFPDSLAPSPFNTYVFGFRDVTGLTATQVAAQRGKAQISAPMMYFDEDDDIYLTLTNLGLLQRPDLFDGHTLHWHGFVNAIPLFDGVPELSLAVPVGRDFTYFYRPHDAGTYMYHCHFEDVEHVQMGMTGMVFIRPKQNKVTIGTFPVGTRYAYNDGDGSTRYDREYAFMITELWSAAHYRDAHIQVNDWTDFDPSFWLLNGRAYPDTIQPNGDPMSATAGRLQYQPISSLITCNSGDRVLLRLSNLGYQNHEMTVDNIDLQIVAKDASLLRGRDGTTNYITTNTVDIGPGESRDVIFVAPQTPGSYLLYDRKYSYLENGGGTGYGGMMTEIRVNSGGVPAQSAPNT
jgi:FtsP/CotA-like multicopper oxidase with cupredoxin domain